MQEEVPDLNVSQIVRDGVDAVDLDQDLDLYIRYGDTAVANGIAVKPTKVRAYTVTMFRKAHTLPRAHMRWLHARRTGHCSAGHPVL